MGSVGEFSEGDAIKEVWAEIDKQAHASLPQPGERTIEQLAQEWGCGVTKARTIARLMISEGTLSRREAGQAGKVMFLPVKKGKP